MDTEIVEIFKDTEDYLKQFIDQLKKEKQALAKNHYDDLINIIEEKKSLSTKIDNINQHMVNYLTSKKLPDTHQALAKYLKKLPTVQADLLSKQWQNIIDLLTQAENLNIQNGLVIMGTKANTERLIDILLGRIRTGIYGKNAKIEST
jgi:flagellar biosynthesis/type III secretory pathway chaperone